MTRDLPPGEELVIPVIAEELRVDKRVKGTRMLVSKVVESEDSTIDEVLRSEQYDVVRVPVDRVVDEPVAPRQEGDTMILPVLREEIIKRIVLVEEIRITRRQEYKREHHELTLRRERVEISRQPDGEAGTED
jgi:stress response protein YsnF